MNIPRPGESSDSPSKFKHDSTPVTRQMTIDEIISNISGIAYYNDVLNDVKNGDYEWIVTKKVVEYAQYLKNNPNSVNNLPPIIVVDGKLDDGSHRISAIYLLMEHMDKNNVFWKSVKLPVLFYNASDIEEDINRIAKLISEDININNGLIIEHEDDHIMDIIYEYGIFPDIRDTKSREYNELVEKVKQVFIRNRRKFENDKDINFLKKVLINLYKQHKMKRTENSNRKVATATTTATATAKTPRTTNGNTFSGMIKREISKVTDMFNNDR